MENKKKITLVTPSEVVARGLRNIFGDLGEFKVYYCLPDLSKNSEVRLKNIDTDILIIDPCVLDINDRKDIKGRLAPFSNAIVVGIEDGISTVEQLKQYDGTFSLYDEPVNIVRKIRSAYTDKQPEQDGDSNELSSREKEILVCVAKGMQNKEIADLYNISIYTVITHRKNITHKTGIKSIAGLTVYAMLNNLIDINGVN